MNEITHQKPKRNNGLAFFCINKPHGNRDLRVDFYSNVKIVIAENGAGKTTLLKLLVAVLSGRMARADYYKFESVEIGFFSEGKIISELINAQEFAGLVADPETALPPKLTDVRSAIGPREFEELLQVATDSESALLRHPVFLRADPHYLGPTSQFAVELRSASNFLRLPDNVKARRKDIREFIEKHFPFEIIYWPTYRRIEDELEASGLMPDRPQFRRPAVDSLMNFGMDDIEKQIKEFTESIRSSTVRQFQVENAKMLSALALRKVPMPHEIESRLERTKDLELVLSRLSSAIEKAARDQIDKLILSRDIFKAENSTLALLLSNLVSIYDDTKRSDEQIKKFVQVSNGYLTNKFWVYDEISVSLEVLSKQASLPIKLSRLSSGEKQLTSMLARLYLAAPRKKKIAVFIDEPELSLSIEWQRKLLPNILESGACDFLFVITHSPFIFENNLVTFVEPLNISLT